MSQNGYKDLIVWQKAMDLVVHIYRVTTSLPPEERFGLVTQMLRSAVSIASNIAEGSKRTGQKDQRNFYTFAYASGAELETQLEILKRLSLGEMDAREAAVPLLQEVLRILHRMTKQF